MNSAHAREIHRGSQKRRLCELGTERKRFRWERDPGRGIREEIGSLVTDQLRGRRKPASVHLLGLWHVSWLRFQLGSNLYITSRSLHLSFPCFKSSFDDPYGVFSRLNRE